MRLPNDYHTKVEFYVGWFGGRKRPLGGTLEEAKSMACMMCYKEYLKPLFEEANIQYFRRRKLGGNPSPSILVRDFYKKMSVYCNDEGADNMIICCNCEKYEDEMYIFSMCAFSPVRYHAFCNDCFETQELKGYCESCKWGALKITNVCGLLLK